MEKVTKIFSVSLSGLHSHKAYAVYNGEQLAVTHILPIKGKFGAWKRPLIEEIEKKKADGFVCIVEEKTDYISRHASNFNLEDVEGDGRSNFFIALDWYFGLVETENIIIANEYQKFMIKAGGEGQRVEKKQDEKGRAIYSINWTAFTSGYRCLLLCVVGAMMEPVSNRYIDLMMSEWLNPDGDVYEDPMGPFRSITTGHAKDRAEAWAKKCKDR